MANILECTDLKSSGNSFNMTKIADLSKSKGNFHSYNKKVVYTTIIKNSQGGYRYKMGIQCYRLKLNVDYTLCTEILNTKYALWHKAKVLIDKSTSQGLTIENVSVRKFSHRYVDSKKSSQFMYHHRVIVNFLKTAAFAPYFLHHLVNIEQDGTDLAIYPKNWTENYIIAYGILGSVSNIDPDKVYDYHTAFEIKPTFLQG